MLNAPPVPTWFWHGLRNILVLLVIGLLTACASVPASITPTAAIPPTETRVPAPLPTSAPSLTATFTQTPTSTSIPSPTPGPQIGAASIGDAYAPNLGNTGFDVLHYKIDLEIIPSITYLTGAVTITAAASVHNLVAFSLDFAGFEISELLLNGEPAEFQRDGEKLFIQSPVGFSLDETFEVFIRYEGVPVQTGSAFVPFFDHLGFQFLGQSAFTYNQPDGAHFWFPCNDHPLDKAAYSFNLSVPTGLVAVANGDLVSFEEAGNRTIYRWENPEPMSTYLVLVAIGDYEMIETQSPNGIPIRHFIFQDLQGLFNDAADVTGEALDWTSEMFGAYPFEHFGFVTSRLIRASLETQGNVLLNEDMLNEETVIHEIAHMWFGDWVTMASWADMWHNEGFAVYVSLMWQTRENPSTINVFMQNLEARVGREGSADPLGGLAPHLLFGFDSYQRGALMIHNLRLTVGDEAFFDALRLYFERFGGGTATRADFIGVFEEVSGMDLGGFFVEWLE